MSKVSDKNVRPTWMRGQLGEVNIERINFLGARVADKKRRVVGCQAAPRSPGSEIAAQAVQAEEVLRTIVPDLNPAPLWIACSEVVVVHIVAVRRPMRVIHVTGFGKPLRPLLSFEIIEHELLRSLDTEGQKIAAFGRPARGKEARGAGQGGRLTGLHIHQLNILGPDIEGGNASEGKLPAVGRPGSIHFADLFRQQLLGRSPLRGNQKDLDWFSGLNGNVSDLRSVWRPTGKRSSRWRIGKLQALTAI